MSNSLNPERRHGVGAASGNEAGFAIVEGRQHRRRLTYDDGIPPKQQRTVM